MYASIIRDFRDHSLRKRDLVQRFGYMGERRAEKPNEMRRQPTPRQQQEATMAARHAGTRREVCLVCPGAQCLEPSGRVWKERDRVQWKQEPAQGLGHSREAAEEAGWGEGGTA